MQVIHCYRSKQDLGINSASNAFFRVRFPLKKIALSASSRKDGKEIILDVNALRIGKCGSGFIPKVYIVRGHNTVESLKASQQAFADVWIGTHVIRKLSIQADDAISSNELSQKLQQLICKRFPTINNNGPYDSAWIQDVYPFENYFIFDRNGELFKQAYVVDPIMRNVALTGAPVKVFKEFSETPKAIDAEGPQLGMSIFQGDNSYYTNTLTQEMQFDTVNMATPLGALPGTGMNYSEIQYNYGPATNEINNPLIKTATNVEQALQVYLADIKNGNHRPLSAIAASMLPTSGKEYNMAVKEAEIVASEAKVRINVRDFIYWQMKNLQAEGTPGSGRAKYRVGDQVQTNRGEGTITGKHSKDTVEVTHVKGGKSNHHMTEISKIVTSPK